MRRNWPGVLGADPTNWLLASDEPWTRYRTMVDLLDRPGEDPEVQAARAEMLVHPQVQALAAETAAWGERALQRHNDAGHPIYKLSTLADFGVRASDADALDGLATGIGTVLAHQSPEGAFQSVLNIPARFGGTGKDTWTWLLCDAPTLLYSLLAMGLEHDPRVHRAVEHLVSAVDDNGWRCLGAPDMGRFRGPGRKTDPCPVVNVYALKALAQTSAQDSARGSPVPLDSPATRTGTGMLLQHWERQQERKIYMFGIGTDYRKLKYPYVWYDILHVVEALSQFDFVVGDERFREMVQTIRDQADEGGRFTASSMYRPWKDWSFADKKNPSPWLTLLCCRVLKRVYG